MRHYAYMRVSTMAQVQNNGIQMQDNEINKYCSDNRIEIADTFADEGISGTIADRDGLQDLLSVLENGDKVVVQNTSRLWRSDIVKVLTIQQIKKAGADIVSIEQPTYSVYTTDPSDFLLNGMMELLDQYERMQISMKLHKGRKAKANKGGKPCGRIAFGYKWNDNAEVVVDYNNNLIVEDIFKQFTSLRSYSALERYCKNKGYKTSTGKDFSKKALSDMLHNDFYNGIVTYSGKKSAGSHEKIITDGLFEEVQMIIESFRKTA